MTNEIPPNGLQSLILNHKGDRSYARLSAACGGVPATANLQRLATRPIVNFPAPDVLMGLAKGLGVRLPEILTAAAISVGLPIQTDPTRDVILEGAGLLPEDSIQLLHSMAENMLWWQEQTEIDQRRTALASRPQDPWGEDVRSLHPEDWGTLAADAGDKGIDPEQLPED